MGGNPPVGDAGESDRSEEEEQEKFQEGEGMIETGPSCSGSRVVGLRVENGLPCGGSSRVGLSEEAVRACS